MKPTGLIALWLHVAPEREDEFNAWYELEHLAQIVSLDGFVSGRRYYSDEAFPKFLALYETRDETVVDSSGFQYAATHPTPWSSRIWTFFGKNRIRLNLRLLTAASRNNATETDGAVGAVVLRTTRRLGEPSDEALSQEAQAALEMAGCMQYRSFRQTQDDTLYLEIFDFATPALAQDEAFAAFLARDARRQLDEDASDIQQHVYTATGVPRLHTDD